MFRAGILLILFLILAGCATAPVSSEALEQQRQADLVVNFRSWNSVSLVKPDITGTLGALPEHTKSFTSAALVKLVRSLRTPRGLIVVVLDRTYSPDPVTAKGGIDAIQQFFEELGFRRVVIQDGAALQAAGGRPILTDTLRR